MAKQAVGILIPQQHKCRAVACYFFDSTIIKNLQDRMLKLYKDIEGTLHYWETWDKDEKTGIIHWGVVGDKGENEEIKSSLLTSFRKKTQKLVDEKIAEGYEEIEDTYILLIEYKVEDMGTPEDLDKRHRLEDRMNEVLGWTGLGHCDGGSIGSGTMEACCFVVDFDAAKKVIEQDLKGTEFENYTKIFDEKEE